MRRMIVRAALAALLLLTSLVSFQPAASSPPSAPPGPGGLIQSLTDRAGGDLRVSYHRGTGLVNFLGGSSAKPLFAGAASATAISAEAGAPQFLAAYGSLFGLTDPAQELSLVRDKSIDDGRSVVRYQQQFAGVPVLGGELIVQMDAAKNVISAGGEILPDITVSTQPVLDAGAAQQIALDATAGWHAVPAADLQAAPPELWLYNPVLLRSNDKGATRLVWRVEVTPVELADIRELVLVDADNGKIALHFNQVDTALDRKTYDGNNAVPLPGPILECTEAAPNCTGGADTHADGAHIHAGQTYTYYQTVHGRDSINGAGLTLTSTVHHQTAYANAFWNGVQMVYGDLYGFPLADDVVAHELTHGVTEYESNLFYYYQSGAINESFSDIWGEFVDLTNGTGNDTAGVRWLLGEDVTGLGALRSLKDPTTFSDPDKMTSPFYNELSGDAPGNDNGGVHTNSGVNNKAAFLMADGATFNGITVSSLGITKTAMIYYEVQTNLLTSGADYLDLYNALNQACANLIGTAGITAPDCVEVQDATNAVEMNLQPVADYNTEAAPCLGGVAPTITRFYDMEAPSSDWTTGVVSGSNRWDYFTGYAHSGLKSLLGNDFPAAATDSFAALNSGIALPAGAFLHFHHAYGFEVNNYDGGVLEYSTNGGGSWVDAGGMIESHGYTGVLQVSNPLGARSAFIGDSHGYIASRVNLLPLSGQTVRFRWRMATDGSVTDQGWWLDDVSIHTCGGGPTPTETETSTPGTPTATATPSNTPTSTATPSSTPTATATGSNVESKVYVPLVSRGVGANPPAWTTIVQETFEGSFPNSQWLVTDPGYDEYFWGKRDCRSFAGGFSAWAMGGGSLGADMACNSYYIDFAYSWMVFGPFSLTGATAADLSYKLWQYSEPGYDFTCSMASTDGNTFNGNCVSGSSGGNWVDRSLNLGSVPGLGNLLGQPNVWIAILFESDESVNFPDGAHVDNIVVRKCPAGTCPASASSTVVDDSQLIETPVTRSLLDSVRPPPTPPGP